MQGSAGSIQAIDHKVNDLVYTVATDGDRGTQREITGLRRLPAAPADVRPVADEAALAGAQMELLKACTPAHGSVKPLPPERN